MSVYRIHIRPKGGLANAKVSFDYCLRENVLGLGWQINTENKNITWIEYEAEATEVHGYSELSRVKYLKNNLKKDDLIWTRDEVGNYYLCKVSSEWEYLHILAAQDADIVNVVRCELKKVSSIDDVPGKIIACFRPPKTIQSINDATANNYSKFLWNKLNKNQYYDLPDFKYENIYSFLNSEEAEDIIFIYLQTKGWLVIPNSRKIDTMGYEFYAIHSKTKERAVVQVKTGNTPLSPKDWQSWKEKVFLFQANGHYDGFGNKNIVCLKPRDIEDFMYNNIDILPSNIVNWLDVLGNQNKI